MKINAFEQMRGANTQLAPLFPYMHAGAIIPCSSSFEVSPESYMGYFVHENSVDEVAVVMGSNGRARTGDVWRGPRKHGVGFDSPTASFIALIITQRQVEAGEQPETVTIQCAKCAEEIVTHHYTGLEEGDSAFPPLPTTVGSLAGAKAFNEPDIIRCKKCGNINREFPIAVWGWDRYIEKSAIAEKAFTALRDAVA